MSVLARWKIRPRLMGVPGVANVVDLRPARPAAAGPGRPRAAARARTSPSPRSSRPPGNALWVSPLTFVEASTPGTGGFIERRNQRLAVQHMLPITTAAAAGRGARRGHRRHHAAARRRRRTSSRTTSRSSATRWSRRARACSWSIEKFPGADTARGHRGTSRRPWRSLAPGPERDPGRHLGLPAGDLPRERAAAPSAWPALLGLLAAAALLVALLLFWRGGPRWSSSSPSRCRVVGAAYVLYLRGTTLTTMTLAGLVAALVVVDRRRRRRRRGGRRGSRCRASARTVASGVSAAELISEAIARIRGCSRWPC